VEQRPLKIGERHVLPDMLKSVNVILIRMTCFTLDYPKFGPPIELDSAINAV
jgi:hypothetical protein